jgi:cold shock protein
VLVATGSEENGRRLETLCCTFSGLAAQAEARCNGADDRRRSSVPNGTVKFFNSERGFGFIQPEGGGKDVFVHISAVKRAGLDYLREGERVTFDFVEHKGKIEAENLRMK